MKVGFKVAHQQYPNKKTVLLFDGFPIKELLSELIMMILMRRMECFQTNKAGREEAKSDPIIFTYNPSRLTVSSTILLCLANIVHHDTFQTNIIYPHFHVQPFYRLMASLLIHTNHHMFNICGTNIPTKALKRYSRQRDESEANLGVGCLRRRCPRWSRPPPPPLSRPSPTPSQP